MYIYKKIKGSEKNLREVAKVAFDSIDTDESFHQQTKIFLYQLSNLQKLGHFRKVISVKLLNFLMKKLFLILNF
jgi:hypothetical protein